MLALNCSKTIDLRPLALFLGQCNFLRNIDNLSFYSDVLVNCRNFTSLSQCIGLYFLFWSVKILYWVIIGLLLDHRLKVKTPETWLGFSDFKCIDFCWTSIETGFRLKSHFSSIILWSSLRAPYCFLPLSNIANFYKIYESLYNINMIAV